MGFHPKSGRDYKLVTDPEHSRPQLPINFLHWKCRLRQPARRENMSEQQITRAFDQTNQPEKINFEPFQQSTLGHLTRNDLQFASSNISDVSKHFPQSKVEDGFIHFGPPDSVIVAARDGGLQLEPKEADKKFQKEAAAVATAVIDGADDADIQVWDSIQNALDEGVKLDEFVKLLNSEFAKRDAGGEDLLSSTLKRDGETEILTFREGEISFMYAEVRDNHVVGVGYIRGGPDE